MKKKPKTEKVSLAAIAKTLQGVATKGDLDKAVEDLAIITNRGFANTVSKEEFGEFKEEMVDFKKKTELTLFNIDSKLQTVDSRLDAIEKTLGPLVHVSSAMQRALRDHERRLSLVEHKVGLTN